MISNYPGTKKMSTLKNLILPAVVLVITAVISAYSQDTSGWEQKDGYIVSKKTVGGISFIQYSNDGKILYTYSGDGYFRKWDVEKGKILMSKDVGIYVSSIAVGQKDDYLAVGKLTVMDKTIVYDLHSLDSLYFVYASGYMFDAYEKQYDENIYEGYITNNKVYIDSEKNELMVIAGSSETGFGLRPNTKTIGARVYFNIETGEEKATYPGNIIYCIYNYSKDRNSVIAYHYSEINYWVGGGGGYLTYKYNNLYFRDFKLNKHHSIYSGSSKDNGSLESFYGAFISNDDRLIYCFSSLKMIKIWDANTGNLYRSIEVTDFPTDIDFPLGDDYLITVDTRHWKEGEEYKFKQLINFRDIDAYARIDSIEFPTNMKWFIAISPDSTSFATGSEDGKIRIFNPKLLSNDLNAIFAADSTTKFSRKPVHFLDYSSGEPDSWYWDFGDGSTSMEQNPSHTYMKTGKYTVKLVVGKDGEKDSLVKEEYIVVRERLNAAIQANKTLGEVPFTVEFKDMSTGEKQNWFWDFGDSTTSDQQNPIHTYNESGTYTVRLIVTDDYGADTLVKEDYIEVLEYMEADFSISDTVGRAPMSVTFSDLSTGNPDSYTWFFGDNYSSTERNPVHTYDNPGVYSVELMIENKLKTSKENKPNMVIVREGTAVSTFQSKSYNLKPLSIPFSDNISFELDLLRTSAVTLTIHDLYGNKLNTLANGNYNAGSHRFLFNGSDLAAGVYFYRLLINGEMETGKVMKIE